MATNPSGSARRRPAPSSPGAPVRARRSTEVPAVAAPARLVVTAGPAAGEEFELSGDEVVVGRASDNAISIPDTSVSRKHVLVRKAGAGWAASDMGSGNGTLVNGRAIAEETPLKAGDLITLGDTELKFEDGSAPAGARRPAGRAAPERPPAVSTGARTRAVVRTSRKGAGEVADLKGQRRKLIIRVGALLVLAVGGAVAFKVVQERKLEDQGKIAAAEAERITGLKQLKQAATNLVREGKWKEARARLTELQETDPDFDKASIEQLLAAATKEIPNQERLAEASDAVAKGEIAAAARALQQVVEPTTLYKQREKVNADLDKRIGERVKDAQTLLGSPGDLAKMTELKALVEDVLVARPEHRDALAFKQVADDAIHRIKNPPVVRAKPSTPWVAVQDRFQTGDQTGAFALAEACAAKEQRCRVLKQQIMDFGDRLKRADSSSPAELAALVELDRKISGGSPSPLSKSYARKAADALCVKATNFKSAGNWVAAIDNAKKALAIDAQSTCATTMLGETNAAAKDKYMQAYTNGDQEVQISLYKEVIQMTPKDNEWHVKAKNQLAKLAQ